MYSIRTLGTIVALVGLGIGRARVRSTAIISMYTGGGHKSGERGRSPRDENMHTIIIAVIIILLL